MEIRRGEVPGALVATKDLTFGLSRMWASFTGDVGIEASVFRDFESAREWILGKRDDDSPERQAEEKLLTWLDPGGCRHPETGRCPR